MTNPSTKSENAPTTPPAEQLLKIPINDTETLHVRPENDRLYYTIHADGCPAYLVNTVEEAVDFVSPHLGTSEKLNKTNIIITSIIVQLKS